jgi:gluconokinase
VKFARFGEESMILVLMGPTGVGKTTIGKGLAEGLGWAFADGDDFHSPANVEKMARGIGLEDADRWPWLAAIHDAMARWDQEKRNVVLACSALKQAYREQLYRGPDVKLVWLTGREALIRERLRHRTGHFASETLLSSQLAIAETPADAITVDVDRPPAEIVALIRDRLGRSTAD